MRKYYLLLVAIVFNATLSFADQEMRSKIGAASAEYLASNFMNGAYLFCDEDGTIEEGANGIHSQITKKNLDSKQQMPVASATKTFTAAGILKLKDQGLLSVDDSVAKHLTADSGLWKDGKLPEWASKVKIHNLLTHRSGLTEYFMGVELDANKPHAEINKDITGFVASKALTFEPGEKHEYNNSNFILLGLIIENVSGKSLGDFYEQEFFTPLGLKDTRLLAVAEAVQHQIDPESMAYPTRYFVTPTGAAPQFNVARSSHLMIPFADGGIASTTADLVKWHKAIHSGKVVSDDSYKLMIKRHYEIEDTTGIKNYMGYGLYISELEGGDVVYHHAGRAVAIRSESGYIPSKNLYFAVLSNVMDYVPQEMMDKIDFTKPENQLDIRYFTQHIFNAIR